jgi:hypothetical protein
MVFGSGEIPDPTSEMGPMANRFFNRYRRGGYHNGVLNY